jgi:hypothetical protein
MKENFGKRTRIFDVTKHGEERLDDNFEKAVEEFNKKFGELKIELQEASDSLQHFNKKLIELNDYADKLKSFDRENHDMPLEGELKEGVAMPEMATDENISESKKEILKKLEKFTGSAADSEKFVINKITTAIEGLLKDLEAQVDFYQKFLSERDPMHKKTDRLLNLKSAQNN